MKLTLLHIVGTPGIGGIQNFLLTLSNYDKRLGLNRNILCLYRHNKNLRRRYLDKNIKVFYCGMVLEYIGLNPEWIWKKIRILVGFLFFPFKYYKTIIISKTDIVICHEPVNLLVQLLVCKIIGIPFMIHMHKEFDINSSSKFLRYLFKHSIFISDSKILLDNNLKLIKDQYKSFIGKVHIIPATSNIEDIVKCTNLRNNLLSGDVVEIGTVGRMTWEKNFEQIIQIAVKLNKNKNRRFHITIIGDGPQYSKIMDLIKINNLSKMVTLVGEKNFEQIIDFYKKFDIYIQTSVSEGSPLTIKEAMAAYLPVISSPISGIREIINDKFNGFLVKNDANSFVESILKVVNMDKEDLICLRLNAQKSVIDKYSAEKISVKYAEVCRKYF